MVKIFIFVSGSISTSISTTALSFSFKINLLNQFFIYPLFHLYVPRGWRDRGSQPILNRNAIPDFKSERLCRGRHVALHPSILLLLIIAITSGPKSLVPLHLY